MSFHISWGSCLLVCPHDVWDPCFITDVPLPNNCLLLFHFYNSNYTCHKCRGWRQGYRNNYLWQSSIKVSYFYLRINNVYIMTRNQINLPIMLNKYFKTNIAKKLVISQFNIQFHVTVLFLLNNLQEFYYLLITESVIFHVW